MTKQSIAENNIFYPVIVFFTTILLSFYTISLYGINTDSLKVRLYYQNGIEKAGTLNRLAGATVSTNPDEAVNYALQAYQISKNNDYSNEIEAISNLVNAYAAARKYDSSDIFVEKGLKLSEKEKDTVHIMEFLTNIGWTYYYQGKYNLANSSFTRALALLIDYTRNHPGQKKINIFNYAKLLNNKATILTRQGYYDSAIIYFKQSLEYRQEHNAGPQLIAPVLLNIGAVCYKNGNDSLAADYFKRAFDEYSTLKDTAQMASCYSNLGLVQKNMGDTLRAIEYYKKALKLYEKANYQRGRIVSLNHLSSLYLQLGEYKKAKESALLALKLNGKKRYKSALAASYQNMALYFLKTGNAEKAIYYGQKGLSIMKEKGQRGNMEQAYLTLSDAYALKGDYKPALDYFKKHNELHDSIFNSTSRANYNKLQAQLESTQKQRQIELLQKEKQAEVLRNKILRDEKQKTIVIFVFTLLLIVTGAVSIYIKRKKDKQIHIQKEIVHKKEQELVKAELEKSKFKEQELQRSVLYKSKQLSSHALHMMYRNTMLQQILDDIKNLSKKAPVEEKPKYKSIINKIKHSLRSQKDWELFKLYFEEVNRSFFQKLSEINPNLTKNDHRLCALIKLNMTSKEMASVLNVAPSSIKSSRHRLKKKLGLDADTDLEEFIKALA